MRKMVAIFYSTFTEKGIDIPYFRTIGLMGFMFFIHVVQISLVFNINLKYVVFWNPSDARGSQWFFAAIYFGTVWTVLSLIFKESKLKEVKVTKKEVARGRFVFWIYFSVNLCILMGLLIRLGIAKGTINI